MHLGCHYANSLYIDYIANLSLLAANSTSACGGNLNAASSSQAFPSPGYPSTYYPNNAYCDWILTAQNGNVIQLQFSAFSTELNYDFVTITSALLFYVVICSFFITLVCSI